MAKVIKKRNELLEKRNRAIILHFSGYAACLLFGILGIELSFAGVPGWICMILGLLSLAGAVMIHCTRDQMGVLEAGVSGEKNAVHILEKALPDHYYCVTNVQVSYENRHNELDAVVVGPTGIYIVEVKNVSGRICGSYTDKQFLQDKGKRSKEMDNPVYQVKMHADILSRFLKANGVRTWVQGTVLFVNPRATMAITDIPTNAIPIFAVSEGGQENLRKYITQPAGVPMSEQDIQKVITLL